MDNANGGGARSSSRLRERLARMFRPASLLRSTCNTTANTCSSSSSSSSSTRAPAAAAAASYKAPPPASACSSSRALLADAAAVARDGDCSSFLASSRRDLVARTESFSTAVDRLHRRAAVAPAPPSRFSVDARPALVEHTTTNKEKEKSPREHHHLGLGGDKMKTKLLSNPYGFSTSDDEATDVVFSTDAEDDLAARGVSSITGSKKLIGGDSAETTTTTTFFSSSRSFSSDSSEFYTTTKKKNKNKSKSKSKNTKPPPAPKKKKPHQQKMVATGSSIKRHQHRRAGAAASSGCDTCGVSDGFRPAVALCAAEEQVRRGFAVVKRSRDPYADFRSSMVEMIVGRQLFGAADMERLLRSYLSLNAPRHHPVILQAFSDIWVVVHGG
ncbi:hypothetical protein HU200_066736 [Digitaria exilis]|uniref:Transcription repressor n=1 Tax=Digitaria exilis TaxID=1010633 RepID=A0A835A658_9POAL|nr:hypothetical protein HU200_066736 [Digitaria exilis]CAB3475677.1 unnamed protein product [Digitaria exilis]